MQENRKLIDFGFALVVKNQLMLKDKSELQETYSGVFEYVAFLDTMIYLLNHEPAFFFISEEFEEKAHSVLQVHRFDIDNEEIQESINHVTKALNEIETCDLDSRREILISYLEWEKEVRNFRNESIEKLLDSMSDDAIVYFHLKGTLDASAKDEYPMSNEVKLASINYLLEMVPEFFKDSEVREKTQKMLDDICRETKIFDQKTKRAYKETKKKYKSLFIEE